jgi:ABC-type multidrug transport system fused ATPase/permease subunit
VLGVLGVLGVRSSCSSVVMMLHCSLFPACDVRCICKCVRRCTIVHVISFVAACAQVVICIIAVFWIQVRTTGGRTRARCTTMLSRPVFSPPFLQWRLTLAMLSIVPVVVGLAVAFGIFAKRVSKLYQKMLAEAGQVAHEKLSSVRHLSP